MTDWSNIDEYQKLSKDQLIDLLKLYGRLALAIDGSWFLAVEKLHDLDKALQLDEDVWHRCGKSDGKLLKRFLDIEAVTSLEDICRLYLLTPVLGNMGARAEIQDDKCYLSVTDCQPQQSHRKDGLGEFPCKSAGYAYFQGFLSVLNPAIRFGCKAGPPGEHLQDLWCNWEVWIEP